MTFDGILDQIIALLKRRGRVSYRAIKRRFDIADDYIEDLKEELLYVHPVIADEAKGLIWTGQLVSASASTSAPASTQSTEQKPSPITYTPKYLTEKILTSRSALEGERKQVTVLFADIKDSTELIKDLDPEAAQ
jgi:hypothetical protein